MIRATFLLLSIAAMASFGASVGSAQDTCQNPVTSSNAKADLNGDGCVDAADLALMQDAIATGNAVGDLNGTGTVNVTDWNLFIQAYNA